MRRHRYDRFFHNYPRKEYFLPQTEVKKLPYFNVLQILQKNLHEWVPHFPSRYCVQTTRCASRLTRLTELGGNYESFAPKIQGEYEFPVLNYPLIRWHAWNYDKQRGLYIDLSHHQWNNNLPQIMVFEGDTTVMVPNKWDTRKQKNCRLSDQYKAQKFKTVLHKSRKEIRNQMR
jgi:hypothetical protein